MKVIITESQYNRAIDFYISHLLDPHEVKTSKDYPNSIFWIKNGEVIVEIENSEYFWVRQHYWSSILNMFNFKEIEAISAIKMWWKEHYNLHRLFAVGPLNDFYFERVDEQLNSQ